MSCFESFVSVLTHDCASRLYVKESDKWCTYNGILFDNEKHVCCSESSSDCCEPDPGILAGLAVGILVFLLLLLLASCAACTCCPQHKRLRGQAPAVVVLVPTGQERA